MIKIFKGKASFIASHFIQPIVEEETPSVNVRTDGARGASGNGKSAGTVEKMVSLFGKMGIIYLYPKDALSGRAVPPRKLP